MNGLTLLMLYGPLVKVQMRGFDSLLKWQEEGVEGNLIFYVS